MKRILSGLLILLFASSALADGIYGGSTSGGGSGVSSVTGDSVLFNNSASTGAVTLSLINQSANTVLAGPTSGGAAAPSYRALVGADLPNPSSSSKGGVQSVAAVSHQFLTSISTSGVPAQAQPNTSDLSDIGTFSLSTSGTAATAAHTITSASASSLAVGPNGATNSVLKVDSSTASQADGITIAGLAAGSGVTLTATSSGSNAPVSIKSLGTGSMTVGTPGSGSLLLQANNSTIGTIASGQVKFNPSASNTASAPTLWWVAPAPTALTAGTDHDEGLYDASSTKTHASNTTVANDYAFHVKCPTIAFASSGGTVTNAYCNYADGPPTGGTNATLTSSSAYYVAARALTNVTNGYGLNINAPTGATNNYAANLVGSVLMSGGSGLQIGSPTGGLEGAGTVNATSVYQNGTQVVSTAGTGLSKSGATLNSNAVYQIPFTPGTLTSVTNTTSMFGKVSNASTVDNLVGSAFLFSCVSNPTITFYECGTSATCASPTTIGTVTVTAAGQAFNGTVSNSAITAGDYVAWAITAGTCTSLDIQATAQVHSN